MKKMTFLMGFSVIVSLSIYVSCTNADATKVSVETVPKIIHSLSNMGLTSCVNVLEADAKIKKGYWKNQYYLNYMSEQELIRFGVENGGLVLNRGSLYKGTVPDNLLSIVSDNYGRAIKALNDLNLDYICPDGRIFSQEDVNKLEKQEDKDWITGADGKGGRKLSEVLVMAPEDMFNNPIITGDPLIVIQVETHGFVEIARW